MKKITARNELRFGFMRTLDGAFEFRGEQGLWLDLPLKVALRNTTLDIKGMEPTKIDKLELPLGLRGPLSAPRIRLDDSKLADALADALVAAGKAELANQVRKQVPDDLKGTVDAVISGKPEEAAKKAAADALKKNLPGGLFGKKKKK